MIKSIKNTLVFTIILGLVATALFLPFSAANAQANNAPVWFAEDSKDAYTGQQLKFVVEAFDPENDPVTLSVVSAPNGTAFRPSDGTFLWTPNDSQTGTYVITFRAFDGQNHADLWVGITVYKSASVDTLGPAPAPSTGGSSNTNRPPIFTNFAPPLKAKVGQLYSYDVDAVDPDGNLLTYTVVSGPAGLIISPTTGLIAWTPEAHQLNFHKVELGVSDGKVQTRVTFFIFVDPAVIAPAPAPAPTPIPSPAPSEPKLIISEMEITINDKDEVIVSWKTNIAASARVIYGNESIEDRNPKNYTYPNATPETDFLAKKHEVNIGELEEEKIFYLRAVAKTDEQVAASREITFVILPGGNIAAFGVASLLAAIGAILIHPLFLILALIILGWMFFSQYRKTKKNSSPL